MSEPLTLVFGGAYDRVVDVPTMGRERDLAIEVQLLSSPKDAFAALRDDPTLAGGETSISFHLTELSRSGSASEFVALPVWISRSFRHANIFVREDSPLTSPADLRGLRIGLPEYGMTMAVWLRGLFADEYGLGASDLEWVSHRAPAGLARESVRYPGEVKISIAPAGRSLPDQLREGAIDAWIGAGSAPPPPGVRRLFAAPFDEEREYYRRTGIFPIMHVLVLRRALVESRPDLAAQVFDTFVDAKSCAQQRLWSTSVAYTTLPWALAAVEDQAQLMGPDPWPYGLQQNLPTLTALLRYLSVQGLLWRDLDLDECFLPLEP